MKLSDSEMRRPGTSQIRSTIWETKSCAKRACMGAPENTTSSCMPENALACKTARLSPCSPSLLFQAAILCCISCATPPLPAVSLCLYHCNFASIILILPFFTTVKIKSGSRAFLSNTLLWRLREWACHSLREALPKFLCKVTRNSEIYWQAITMYSSNTFALSTNRFPTYGKFDFLPFSWTFLGPYRFSLNLKCALPLWARHKFGSLEMSINIYRHRGGSLSNIPRWLPGLST